jgi:exopolyphosphatase / guanosine-5'-triphosphate,3'-diphosphate pyrophosphatase
MRGRRRGRIRPAVRVAAVDCGTNALKLLVADLDPSAGTQHDLVRELHVTRLGQGVDRTGVLAPAALARTLAVLDGYAATARRLGVERVRCCATSAARDARNGAELAAGVRDRLGVTVEVLTGPQEAALSYAGVVRGLQQVGHQVGLPRADPVLVVDIGGGSTELVLGEGARVLAAASADVGAVRLTERYLADDPPTAAQRDAAAAAADVALTALAVRPADARTLVGVSGTAVTVAAHALGLSSLDADRLHGARVGAASVRASCAALLAAGVSERRAMPVMHPGRADVIGGGAVVLDRVLAGALVDELVVSTHDVLDGIAWSLVEAA